MTGVSILHVLTSAMAMSSTSRLLGERVISKFDSPKVLVRDLGTDPVPIIDQVNVDIIFAVTIRIELTTEPSAC